MHGDCLLAKLEAWRNSGGKSRAVSIQIDDGYGASCWTVALRGHGKELVAAEVSFWRGIPNGEAPNQPGKFFYAAVPEDSDDDWPGLAAVIELALQKAEEHGL